MLTSHFAEFIDAEDEEGDRQCQHSAVLLKFYIVFYGEEAEIFSHSYHYQSPKEKVMPDSESGTYCSKFM